MFGDKREFWDKIAELSLRINDVVRQNNAVIAELENKLKKLQTSSSTKIKEIEAQLNSLSEIPKTLGELKTEVSALKDKLKLSSTEQLVILKENMEEAVETLSEKIEAVKQYSSELGTKLQEVENKLHELIRQHEQKPLSDREKQVLELRQKGMNQKDIAKQLGVGQPYVSRVMGSIKKKGYEVY